MNEGLEAMVFCGAMVGALVLNIAAGRRVMRQVDEGRMGRFAGFFWLGLGALFLGAAPVLIGGIAWLIAGLFGVRIFGRGNEGMLTGMAIAGAPVAFVTMGIFALMLLVQAIGSGRPSVRDRR